MPANGGAGRDGMYRFEQDVMRELEAGGIQEHLQERWKKALSERLPSICLPVCPAGEGGAWPWRENLGDCQRAFVAEMSRLGQLEEGFSPILGRGWSLPWSWEAALARLQGLRGSRNICNKEEGGFRMAEAYSRAALNRKRWRRSAVIRSGTFIASFPAGEDARELRRKGGWKAAAA